MKQYPAAAARIDRPKTLELKHSLALRLRLARLDAGVTQGEVAASVGTNVPRVHRWEQGDEPIAPNVLHVAKMDGPSRPVAVEAIRFQADVHGLQVLERARIVHGDRHVERLAAVTMQCTDAPRALAAALADGELTDDELEMIALEGKQAAETALELDAWAVDELLRRRGAR